MSDWLRNNYSLDVQATHWPESMSQSIPESYLASSVPSDALDQVLEVMASPHFHIITHESYSPSSSTSHFPEVFTDSSPSGLAYAEAALTNNFLNTAHLQEPTIQSIPESYPASSAPIYPVAGSLGFSKLSDTRFHS